MYTHLFLSITMDTIGSRKHGLYICNSSFAFLALSDVFFLGAGCTHFDERKKKLGCNVIQVMCLIKIIKG